MFAKATRKSAGVVLLWIVVSVKAIREGTQSLHAALQGAQDYGTTCSGRFREVSMTSGVQFELRSICADRAAVPADVAMAERLKCDFSTSEALNKDLDKACEQLKLMPQVSCENPMYMKNGEVLKQMYLHGVCNTDNVERRGKVAEHWKESFVPGFAKKVDCLPTDALTEDIANQACQRIFGWYDEPRTDKTDCNVDVSLESYTNWKLFMDDYCDLYASDAPEHSHTEIEYALAEELNCDAGENNQNIKHTLVEVCKVVELWEQRGFKDEPTIDEQEAGLN